MYNTIVQAIELVLEHEGGYVNHPNDPGGETKYGISKRQYPHLDIATLTQQDAIQIYMRDYWDRIWGTQLPSPIAIVVFDTAVNSGVTRASRWLQKLSGATVDGKIGPRTVKAVYEWYMQNPEQAVNEYLDYRLEFLQRLKHWDSFKKGWTRRVEAVRDVALKSVTEG